MSRCAAYAWVVSVCSGLRLSQAKTLGHLVTAALCAGRATLAALGRQLAGPATRKHKIKRAWRFCANDRVHVADAMHGVIEKVCKRRRKRLLVAVDWTRLRDFHTLMAAAVIRGRAVPLLWASYTDGQLHRSQNDLEEGLLRLLRALVPGRVPMTLLADRGFGRTELARTCQGLGLRYLIRVRPDVWVEAPGYAGLLSDYPVQRGMARVLRGVRYRKEEPVVQRVVVRWKKGLPAGRDEPWFLMTDLAGSAYALTDLYAKRMTVEELFRDDKSGRTGFGLGQTQLTQAARVDRLLLVVALAYLLLVGVGLVARVLCRPGAWCSSNDPAECSDFTIGRVMIDDLEVDPERALAAVAAATQAAAPNWG